MYLVNKNFGVIKMPETIHTSSASNFAPSLINPLMASQSPLLAARHNRLFGGSDAEGAVPLEDGPAPLDTDIFNAIHCLCTKAQCWSIHYDYEVAYIAAMLIWCFLCIILKRRHRKIPLSTMEQKM